MQSKQDSILSLKRKRDKHILIIYFFLFLIQVTKRLSCFSSINVRENCDLLMCSSNSMFRFLHKRRENLAQKIRELTSAIKNNFHIHRFLDYRIDYYDDVQIKFTRASSTFFSLPTLPSIVSFYNPFDFYPSEEMLRSLILLAIIFDIFSL